MATGDLAYASYRPLVEKLVSAVRHDVRYAEAFAMQSTVQSTRRSLKALKNLDHAGKTELADV